MTKMKPMRMMPGSSRGAIATMLDQFIAPAKTPPCACAAAPYTSTVPKRPNEMPMVVTMMYFHAASSPCLSPWKPTSSADVMVVPSMAIQRMPRLSESTVTSHLAPHPADRRDGDRHREEPDEQEEHHRHGVSAEDAERAHRSVRGDALRDARGEPEDRERPGDVEGGERA